MGKREQKKKRKSKTNKKQELTTTPPSPQAAAPQPPQIIPSETASTASLIDVDTPSVRTVPSDFLEQLLRARDVSPGLHWERRSGSPGSR
ncbi:hypothetical protein O1611_g3420 [Lasiodiplodia mahajangana]|uniref:Uncharacterized protein n=1 Tax=Lasiodiplodia mahajangana TaxID=1108764 RepID=A0ACC2JS27_9PEZI|nr:hypothetical protein O1611_g3420 [Lasiodiplodia mahajangana]